MRDFLENKITIKAGWKEAKQNAIEAAGQVLRGEKPSKKGKLPSRYRLTDEELKNAFEAYSDEQFAEDLEKIENKEKRETMKYTILDTVQAQKNAGVKNINYIQIAGDVIAEKITASMAIKEKTKGARKKRRNR